MSWQMPSVEQDITGLNNSGMERQLLLADFAITLNGVFNFAADLSHDVFRHVNLTSVTRTSTVANSGQTLANEVLFNSYVVSRPADGSLTWTAAGELNSTIVPVWT